MNPPPSSSTKHGKNNRNSNTNHAKKRIKKKHPHGGGAHNNWIETCSESANRALPKDCVAPLLCVITRAEINDEDDDDDDVKDKKMKGEEVLLLGKWNEKYDQIAGSFIESSATVINDECTLDATTEQVDDGDGDGNNGKDIQSKVKNDVVPTSSAAEVQHSSVALALLSPAAASSSTINRMPNIAMPSSSFLVQYMREKVPFQLPSTSRGDDAQEKRLFIPVKRHISATGPTKWAQLQSSKGTSKKRKQRTYHPLPNGNNGDGICNPYPTSCVPDKFWAQRKRLFSRYDEGIRIGGEGLEGKRHDVEQDYEDTVGPEMWYSVTPESIANHIAERMTRMIVSARKKKTKEVNETRKALTREPHTAERSSSIGGWSNQSRGVIILDAFCGCGGNSIAFARRNESHDKKKVHEYCDDENKDVNDVHPLDRVKVIAVENNLSRLKMAAHNAAIYNVPREDIVFIHADAIEVLNHFRHGSTRMTPRNNDCGSREGGVKEQDASGTVYAGYTLGGIDLLPSKIDGIFLSPPWGGMDYGNMGGKSGFDPLTSITIESCVSSVNEPHGEEEGTTTGTTTATAVTTNGGELLRMAANAVFDDTNQEGVVAYFLPRNINGITLGKIAVACDIQGFFEMEQNVVNGKVKTVTAYFSRDLQEEGIISNMCAQPSVAQAESKGFNPSE